MVNDVCRLSKGKFMREWVGTLFKDLLFSHPGFLYQYAIPDAYGVR